MTSLAPYGNSRYALTTSVNNTQANKEMNRPRVSAQLRVGDTQELMVPGEEAPYLLARNY